MPNWCSNTLSVTGTVADVAAFIEAANGYEQKYVGPFNDRSSSGPDWGKFTPIQIEVMMNDESFFTSGAKKSNLSFHALVPVPREVMLSPYDPASLKEAVQKYPEWFSRFPNICAGYDWESNNWGCKWGASDVGEPNVTDVGEGSVAEYNFETPWGPPREFMNKVAEKFKSLEFNLTFSEEGCGFGGECTWSDGSLRDSADWDLDQELDEEESDEESESN
jgi:hypothetical protein